MKRVVLFSTLCSLFFCSIGCADAMNSKSEEYRLSIKKSLADSTSRVSSLQGSLNKLRTADKGDLANKICEQKIRELQQCRSSGVFTDKDRKDDKFLKVFSDLANKEKKVFKTLAEYDLQCMFRYLLSGAAKQSNEHIRSNWQVISEKTIPCKVNLCEWIAQQHPDVLSSYSLELLKYKEFQTSFAKGFLQTKDAAVEFDKVWMTERQQARGDYLLDIMFSTENDNMITLFSKILDCPESLVNLYNVLMNIYQIDTNCLLHIKGFFDELLKNNEMRDLIMASMEILEQEMIIEDDDIKKIVDVMSEERHCDKSCEVIAQNLPLARQIMCSAPRENYNDFCKLIHENNHDFWDMIHLPRPTRSTVLWSSSFDEDDAYVDYCDLCYFREDLRMEMRDPGKKDFELSDDYVSLWMAVLKTEGLQSFDADGEYAGGLIAADKLVNEMQKKDVKIDAVGVENEKRLRDGSYGIAEIPWNGPFSFEDIIDGFNLMLTKIRTEACLDSLTDMDEFVKNATPAEKLLACDWICKQFMDWIFGDLGSVYLGAVASDSVPPRLLQLCYLANKASCNCINQSLVDAGKVLTIEGLTADARGGGEQYLLNAHYVNLSVMFLMDLVELNFLNLIYTIGSTDCEKCPGNFITDIEQLLQLRASVTKENLLSGVANILNICFLGIDFLRQQVQIVDFFDLEGEVAPIMPEEEVVEVEV